MERSLNSRVAIRAENRGQDRSGLKKLSSDSPDVGKNGIAEDGKGAVKQYPGPAVKGNDVAVAGGRPADLAASNAPILEAVRAIAQRTLAIGLCPDEVAQHQGWARAKAPRARREDAGPFVAGNDVARQGRRPADRGVAAFQANAPRVVEHRAVANRQRARDVRADVIALNEVSAQGSRKMHAPTVVSGNDVPCSGRCAANDQIG